MDIVDAQVHVFHKMDEVACLFAMDCLGIQSVVIDEIWPGDPTGVSEPAQMLDNGVLRPLLSLSHRAAKTYPDRFKYLQRIHPLDPEMEALVRMAGSDPNCLALRVEAWPHHAESFKAGDYGPLFEAAARVNLPVCVLNLCGAPLLEPYITAIPQCRFVIDQVGIARGQEMFGYVLGLARYSNVSLKWCQAHRFFEHEGYPYRPIQVALRRAVDAFGKERVIWASDATVAAPDITWGDTLYYVRENDLLTLEEREWVLGRACRTQFGWPAPGAQA